MRKFVVPFYLLLIGIVHAQDDMQVDNELFEILITSGLREQKLSDQPLSATVQTQQSIDDRGSRHFEELLPTILNTLFSGETSRPRYIQLRGIGERSEYTGAPNASVGMLIDDIDFSGISMIGSLLDVKQAEVLRGPQGTRYGANAFDYFDLISTSTYANSDITYSYDEDWVFTGFWDIEEFGFDYRAFFQNDKERDTYSQELRFVSNPASRIFNGSTDWVAGVYGLKLDESNETEETFSGFLASDYEAINSAVFGQLDTRFTPKLTLTSSLRIENRDADYSDSNDQEFSPDDTMVGGQLALSYQINQSNNVYGSVSRGYKAGGVNPVVDAGFPVERRTFDPEFLTNYEIGWHFDNPIMGLTSNLSLFYMQRDDLQVDWFGATG